VTKHRDCIPPPPPEPTEEERVFYYAWRDFRVVVVIEPLPNVDTWKREETWLARVVKRFENSLGSTVPPPRKR
jgi:hypothetical protein